MTVKETYVSILESIDTIREHSDLNNIIVRNNIANIENLVSNLMYTDERIELSAE